MPKHGGRILTGPAWVAEMKGSWMRAIKDETKGSGGQIIQASYIPVTTSSKPLEG